MGRLALLLLVCVIAGGLFFLQRRRTDVEHVGPPTTIAAKRIVSDVGCGAGESVVFALKNASVGVPVAGTIGRQRACEGEDVEHMSGEVDWGDGTSSPLAPATAAPKEEALVVAGQHVYKQAGRFAVFARIRAQCADRGQSTRVISCGTGVVDVRPQ